MLAMGLSLPAAAAQLDLALAARVHRAPSGAPDTVAVVSSTPARAVVVYLHGWESCARGVVRDGSVDCGDGRRVTGLGLGRVVEASPAPFALLVPQLAYLQRSGSVGAWVDPAAPSRWLAEATRRSGLAGPGNGLVVVAHSGGYQAAAAMVRADPPLPIRAIVLLDALYGQVEAFAGWAAGGPDRTLVSVHTAHAATTARNQELAVAVTRRLGPSQVRVLERLPPGDLRDTPLVVARTGAAHGTLPAVALGPVLRGLAGVAGDQ